MRKVLPYIILFIFLSLLLLVTAFWQLSILHETRFLFISQDNYDYFFKLVQTLSLFSIPFALCIEEARKNDEKNKLKIERTLNYLNTWREGHLYNHYISIQNVLTQICFNPQFEDIFEEQRHKIKKGKEEEYKQILKNYLFDPKNKEKQHDFSRIRSFLFEVLTLTQEDYLDVNIIHKILIKELMYIWVYCFLYYEDSLFKEDVAKIHEGLFAKSPFYDENSFYNKDVKK